MPEAILLPLLCLYFLNINYTPFPFFIPNIFPAQEIASRCNVFLDPKYYGILMKIDCVNHLKCSNHTNLSGNYATLSSSKKFTFASYKFS